MKLLTLEEFQKLTSISDRAIVWLLKNKKLACQINDQNELLVDIESAQIKDLVSAISARHLELMTNNRRLVSERLAKIVSSKLEEFLDQALQVVINSR
ncbi:MAG: hypothetical protein KDD42_01025 [Bdellovibrionales bacterium]|nr:hypothetical protein [Bdellovibrionales bacterium]